MSKSVKDQTSTNMLLNTTKPLKINLMIKICLINIV